MRSQDVFQITTYAQTKPRHSHSMVQKGPNQYRIGPSLSAVSQYTSVGV